MNEMPSEPEYQSIEYKDVSAGKPVIVVGAGPGGLFAALRLIELGLRPIIVERGKDVRERKKDIALISREHKVNGESNYSLVRAVPALILMESCIPVARKEAR